MPLSFLVPAFLAGLAAVAIPIWVHLRNRPHADAMDFPSLMFLERVPQRSVQRQTLRHRSLLAVRILALATIALAFARPFFVGGDGPLALGEGAREVVVAIDGSWSMGYGDRWSRAVAAAREHLSGLTPADRVSLVLFDRQAEVVVAGAQGGDRAAAALGALSPGNAGTDLGAGLRAGAEILERSELPGREIVLISDFQRRGWGLDAELELPADVRVVPVAIADEEAVNAGIAEVVTRRDPESPDRVAVTARLTRAGGDRAVTVPVSLEIAGEVAQEIDVELPATGAAQAVFAPVEVADGLEAVVRLPADRLRGDDEFFVAAGRGRPLAVTVFENPRANATDSFYLEQALRIGSAPPLTVDVEVLSDVTAASLAGTDVVVLNDTGSLDTGSAGALRAFVERGGGLLVALGEQTDDLGGAELVPLALGDVVDRAADLGATLAFVSAGHPALELFTRGGGDLAAVRTYRYRSLDPAPAEGVLLRYDDGGVALAEIVVGDGRILVWTTTFDNFWTDLPLRPAFLPLLHELVRHAAGYREPPAWLPAASPIAPHRVAEALGEALSTTAEVLVDGQAVAGSTGLSPGLRRVEWRDGPRSGAGTVAVNLDRTEADLATIDAEEVVAAVRRPQGAADEPDAAAAVRGPEVAERGQSLWWYLLVVAFLVLLAETALSNRLSPRAS